MDYRKLRYFCAVATEGSLHRATEKLNLSQPALTRAIQDLEADLQAKLFTRHARGVTLTEEGRILLDHAHGLLSQAEAARDAVAAVAEHPRGLVSIGVPPSLSISLMVPLVCQVSEKWPSIQLNMHERMMPDLLDMIVSEQLDAAIVANPPTLSTVALKPLLKEDVFLVGTQDQPLPGLISVDELARYPLIFPGSGIGSFSWFEEMTRNSDLKCSARLRVESPQLSIALVCAGQGYAVLPRSALRLARGGEPLSVARILGLRLERYLATSSVRPLSRAAATVVGILEREASRLSTTELFASSITNPHSVDRKTVVPLARAS